MAAVQYQPKKITRGSSSYLVRPTLQDQLVHLKMDN
jgi:hypothetical protein